MSGFGRGLRAYRKAKGMTLKEMASIAGISIAYLSDIERGRNIPPRDRLDSLAQSLGMTYQEFDDLDELLYATKLEAFKQRYYSNAE